MLKGSKPVAVLLCNFTNSQNPKPYTKQAVEAAFMANNSTSINAFWIENSFGLVNLRGTKVFDWITIPLTNGRFSATYALSPNRRHDIIEAAKRYVGGNFSNFATTIVFFSDPVGTVWSQDNGAIFDPNVANATNICHEMGHLLGGQFGVTDSFDFTSRKNDTWAAPGQYYDQTDIMSAQNVWAAANNPDNSCFGNRGPNFSPVHKMNLGWYGGNKIKSLSKLSLANSNLYQRVLLNSRSNTKSGLKAIHLALDDDYFIELATIEGFDEGLPQNGVLMHQSSSGLSYVIVPNLAKPDEKFWQQNAVFKKTFKYKNPQNSVVAKTATIYITIGEYDDVQKTVEIHIGNEPMYFPNKGKDIEIVAIGLSHSTAGGGTGFEYISYVGVKDSTGTLRRISRADVVDWILAKRNTFYVLGSRRHKVPVIVERHWIKTVADGESENNLLSLPHF